MAGDLIVDEVRAIREAIAKEHGYTSGRSSRRSNESRRHTAGILYRWPLI